MAKASDVKRPVSIIKNLPEGRYMIHRDGLFTGHEDGSHWVPYPTSNLPGEAQIEVDRMITQLGYADSDYLGYVYTVGKEEDGEIGGLMKYKPTIEMEEVEKPARSV